jgi:hypothetical protein
MKEYKISKGWAIIIYITAPLLIGLFAWLLIMPWVTGSQQDMEALWILGPVSVGMIVFLLIALLDTIKGKFVIADDKIWIVSTLSKRELTIDEIKGYRIADKYIFIESNVKGKRKITLNTYYENSHEIIDWLSENYLDLDVIEAYDEEREILGNEALGWTLEQREAKLAKAHKMAKVLNWTGGLIGIWTFFWASPYEYAIIASIAFPILCLIVLKFSNGLIRINEKKENAYPVIFWGIFATSMGLCLRGLMDYNIFDYSNVWTPSISVTLAYTALLTIGSKEFKLDMAKGYWMIIGYSILIFCYGYGAVITLNCMYDKSEPEIFHATILNKRIDSGKLTTYYLELTPWAQQSKSSEFTVSKELYNNLHIADTVNIVFKQGNFDIPWFEIR